MPSHRQGTSADARQNGVRSRQMVDRERKHDHQPIDDMRVSMEVIGRGTSVDARTRMGGYLVEVVTGTTHTKAELIKR
jgi:hypothetical protein